MIRGKETFVTVEGRPNFGNIEEYFATVIANIYLSEKGKEARLVGAYAPDSANPPKDWSVMKDPDGFYRNNDGLSIPPDRLMDTFQHTQRLFYRDLALLPTPPWFNPVRIHFKRHQKIPTCSDKSAKPTQSHPILLRPFTEGIYVGHIQWEKKPADAAILSSLVINPRPRRRRLHAR